MDADDKRNLQQIAEDVKKLAGAIPQPPSHIRRFFEIVTTVIAAMGIVSVVDIVIKWLLGG